ISLSSSLCLSLSAYADCPVEMGCSSALHLNPISITTPVSDAVTFIATLMGAVVGGAISIAGTIYFNKAEQSKNNKARAYNLLQTASQMYSDMANIVGHIEREMESKRLDIESGAPIWTVDPPGLKTRH
ncbi:hypothetical protein, partial [Agrobacterium bohemicum]|uniref:hypothetical protein n=1 Tax=Agrobacterium bohemicum TaxID=2052828 RepID=UPI000B0CF83E